MSKFRPVCLAALAMLTTIAMGSTALAQYPGNPVRNFWSNESSGNDDYARCSQRDLEHSQRTLRACGRIIGERGFSQVTAGAYYFRGLMYATLGDMERARSDYENAYRFFTLALDSQRRDPDTYNNRATVLLRLGRYDEAISDIDRAISLSDSSADVVMGSRARPNSANRRSGQLANLQTRRGFANALRGDWVSAITAYDDAARFAPDDPLHEADQCAGRAAARIELEAARAYCEHALRVGTNFTTLFAQAFLDFVEGDLPRARAGFEAAALTYPDSPFAEYALGVVDAHMGLAEGYTRAAAAESKIDPFDLLFYKNAGLRLP